MHQLYSVRRSPRRPRGRRNLPGLGARIATQAECAPRKTSPAGTATRARSTATRVRSLALPT
ncbi:hypothetical protein [Streptomyces luteolus]|uniref:Uncharacterized protein n=1 Tax=Streptomyces luteolus TaxID=3043615 RepID=A0ABT6T0P8_9ACTN|nr:hypothetical protein [Streptomyces sp. B-S-A12]MDI3421216.1 hypothetical protein [Streptomyces sp. B-S-A12]